MTLRDSKLRQGESTSFKIAPEKVPWIILIGSPWVTGSFPMEMLDQTRSSAQLCVSRHAPWHRGEVGMRLGMRKMSVLKRNHGSRQKLTIFSKIWPFRERVEGMGEGRKKN